MAMHRHQFFKTLCLNSADNIFPVESSLSIKPSDIFSGTISSNPPALSALNERRLSGFNGQLPLYSCHPSVAHKKLGPQCFHHQPVYPRFQRAIYIKIVCLAGTLPIQKDIGNILETNVIRPYRYRIPLSVYLLLEGEVLPIGKSSPLLFVIRTVISLVPMSSTVIVRPSGPSSVCSSAFRRKIL